MLKNLVLLLSVFVMAALQLGCSSGEVSQNPTTITTQEDSSEPLPVSDPQPLPETEPTPDPEPVPPKPEPLPPEPEPLPPEPQPDAGCQPNEDELLMLQLVNAARAESRQCGNESYAATQALAWDCDLRNAAEAHTQDMVENNFFNHTGSDGLNVGDRVTAAGYQWRAVGENIAAGYMTEEQVMQGWLDSPGHCANIMNPAFQEFGSAVIFTDLADYSSYWTQVFATPR